MSLRVSVQTALDAQPPESRDAAAAELALTYAGAIDSGGDMSKLGPPLLAALESLRMTPRARAAATKAVNDDKPAANPLDQLAGRRARRGRTPDLDAAAEGSH
jgi:hypothetical protein